MTETGTGPIRLGAIDVGSNSIRLTVADWDAQGGLHIIDELKDQPRLATGLAASGQLSPDAVARALDALGRMRDVAERRGVKRIAAVATAAVREAGNGPEFVDVVRSRLGIPLDIIDADTEARLSYRSIAHHFRLEDRRTLIADIGGGSLDVAGAVRGLLELTISLPLGAVRLTELYLPKERSASRALPALRKAIRREFRKATRWRDWRAAQVYGSGGSFTNLGRIAAARRGLPTDPVHGVMVTTAEVEHLLEWLAAMDPADRHDVPGLNPQRADIIVAGLAVSAELLELVDAPSVTVSAFGIREGLLLEMAGAGAPPEGDPLRLAREFALRCQCDPSHIEQVRRLALQLFDRLGPALGAEPAERTLLEAAALLHDVGQLVSYRKRHRHSYELILHAERLNLPVHDRRLVALTALYHRKKGPRKTDPEFEGLDREERATVRRLAALLRVADGLDRGYTAVVETVRTHLTARRLRIIPSAASPEVDLALECWGANRRTDVLAELLGRDVVVTPPASRLSR